MRIEMDTVVNEGETTEGVATEMALGLDVRTTVVTEHGPAGGNPIIAYEGSEEDLRQVARRYGGDAEELYLG